MSAPPCTTRGRTLDHAAAVYDALQPFMTLGSERAMNRAAIAELDIAPDDRVLDIGCGTGVLTRRIGNTLDAAIDGRIVGIDAAPHMITVANRKRSSPTTSFETAAAEQLPFDDGVFTKAVSSFFFHHVDYELKVACLRELRRVLTAPSRVIILDVDMPTSWLGNLSIRAGEWLFQQPEIRENRLGLLRKAFDDAGFSGWKTVRQWQGYITLFSMETC